MPQHSAERDHTACLRQRLWLGNPANADREGAGQYSYSLELYLFNKTIHRAFIFPEEILTEWTISMAWRRNMMNIDCNKRLLLDRDSEPFSGTIPPQPHLHTLPLPSPQIKQNKAKTKNTKNKISMHRLLLRISNSDWKNYLSVG